MSSVDPKRSWDADQGNGIADLTSQNCSSPEKRSKKSTIGSHAVYDPGYVFEAPIGVPSSSSSSLWMAPHRILTSPNPFRRSDPLETPRGENALSPKTPKSDFRFFDILSPLGLGASPSTSLLPQSEIGKNFPSSKDWSPFVNGFAAVGEEFSFSEFASNSHQPIRFSPKTPLLDSVNDKEQSILNLGSSCHAGDDAISPTSTERSFNMMDELSTPNLILGLDNDSNEHFVNNKQALAVRLGGGNGRIGNDAYSSSSSSNRDSQIFSGLPVRNSQRFGEGTNGFGILITAAAAEDDDRKGVKDLASSSTHIFSAAGVSGVTSPAILRPVRQSTSFYSSSYKNAQNAQAQAESNSSSSFQPETGGAVHTQGGKLKKTSQGFSTSSSGAFSSLQPQPSSSSSYSSSSSFPSSSSTFHSNQTSTSSLKSAYSPTLSSTSSSDSVLKESATQATSNYFKDKHQEMNLPAKFVKQILKAEKERCKLKEKEKAKMLKLQSSALKSSNNVIKSSTSTSTASAVKSKFQSQDFMVSSEEKYEGKNNIRNGDYSTTLSWKEDTDGDNDNDAMHSQGGNDDNYDDNFGSQKKNKRLGKLGKISKSRKLHNNDEGIEMAMNSNTDMVSNTPQSYSGTPSSHSVVLMDGTSTSASACASSSTSTSTSTPTILLPDADSNSGPSGTPGLPPTTPGGSQMHMLMCAVGSQLGSLSEESMGKDEEMMRDRDRDRDREREREREGGRDMREEGERSVKNKVGRPKLTFKEKMSRELRAPKELKEKKAERERERERERENHNPPISFISPAAAVAQASMSTSKPISCACKRSKCLKLYCDCFRFSKFCDGCACNDCANKGTREEERMQAINVILERNPDAFKPIVKESASTALGHKSGCHCKRSACLKKYCECFTALVPCSDRCRCVDCKNTPDLYTNISISVPIGNTQSTRTASYNPYLNSSHANLPTFRQPNQILQQSQSQQQNPYQSQNQNLMQVQQGNAGREVNGKSYNMGSGVGVGLGVGVGVGAPIGLRSPDFGMGDSVAPSTGDSNLSSSSACDGMLKPSLQCISIEKEKSKRPPHCETDSVGSKLIRNLSLMQPDNSYTPNAVWGTNLSGDLTGDLSRINRNDTGRSGQGSGIGGLGGGDGRGSGHGSGQGVGHGRGLEGGMRTPPKSGRKRTADASPIGVLAALCEARNASQTLLTLTPPRSPEGPRSTLHVSTRPTVSTADAALMLVNLENSSTESGESSDSDDRGMESNADKSGKIEKAYTEEKKRKKEKGIINTGNQNIGGRKKSAKCDFMENSQNEIEELTQDTFTVPPGAQVDLPLHFDGFDNSQNDDSSLGFSKWSRMSDSNMSMCISQNDSCDYISNNNNSDDSNSNNNNNNNHNNNDNSNGSSSSKRYQGNENDGDGGGEEEIGTNSNNNNNDSSTNSNGFNCNTNNSTTNNKQLNATNAVTYDNKTSTNRWTRSDGNSMTPPDPDPAPSTSTSFLPS